VDLARASARAKAGARWSASLVVAAGVLALVLAAGLATKLLRPPRLAPPATVVAAPREPASARQAVVEPTASEAAADRAVVPGLVAVDRGKPAAVKREGAMAAKIADGPARARRWAEAREEPDPRLLLFLADSAHAERDGAACLTALNRLSSDAWPAGLAERARRRRATCEMLRGNCERGRRLLAPLDGSDGARASLLADCPATSLRTTEERLEAVAEQADEARYAGNPPARRRELRQILLSQTASREVQSCLRNAAASRACGRRLSILARAYQVVAESFLAGGDCPEGAALDVMQNQIKLQSLEPEEADPALRCRAQRTVDVYQACAPAAAEAERRCVARLQAASGPPP
jgi:hypothetical protein